MEASSSHADQSIVISGSHGFIGSMLTDFLARQGASIHPLLRPQSRPAPNGIRWDPQGHTIDTDALEGVDAVISLGGENIFGFWTRDKREQIYRSRIETTTLLAESVARLDRKPRVFLCASAVGYYGDRGDEVLTEDAPAGKGFLADVCRDWEAACQPAAEAGIRVVNLRFGLVMGEGGSLEVMKPLFKLGLGGPIGDGFQWVSWIAREDLCRAVGFLLDCDSITGPVNMGSPNPVHNHEFVRAFAEAIHRPALVPVPAFAVRLRFGRFADEVLLASARMTPQKLLSCGFTFRHPDIAAAIKDLYAQ